MAQEEFVPADTQSGFLGWRICAAGVLTQAVAIGFTLGSVGVFAAPLAEELGATATQFNLAVSLFSLVMNLSMPPMNFTTIQCFIHYDFNKIKKFWKFSIF